MDGAVLSFRCRLSALEREAVWRLTPDALERAEDGGGAQRFAYRDAIEVRLSFAPTRFDTRRYRCDVRLPSAAATIASTSYAGLASFEDRAGAYTPFVRALVARIAQAAPACAFLAGKRPLAYWAEHIFLLSMLLLAALVIEAVAGVPLSAIVAIKLGIIAAYLPLAVKYGRRNWPRRFSPDSIPPEVLP